LRHATLAALLTVAALVGTAGAQVCSGPHYRWTEKTTLSLAGLTPTYATITQMLTTSDP
jgi:hypothetical protein